MGDTHDAPDTLKGYGYEEKDDDGAVDPMDELLDAYQGFVRRGLGDLADEAMSLIHELQGILLGVDREMEKGHSMGYSSPVACLSQAYLALAMSPVTRDLAQRVLALMDRAATAMMPTPQEMPDEDATQSDDVAPADRSNDDADYRAVRREIREEADQFCVYSETGRSFGCYSTRDAAQQRLAQIEQFARSRVSASTRKELVALHEQAHQVQIVTEAVKAVHDLVSDELEIVHGLAEPYAIDLDDKMAMLESADPMVMQKAAEYRYTLGPAYVPDREDAHGEFTDPDTLQRAMWDWVRKGDRTIYLQHSDKAAGEMVELMTMPFPLEASLTVPAQGVTKYQFPANTPFLGVIWEDWAWDLVKAGELRGYSIGGSAKRMEADLPTEALV